MADTIYAVASGFFDSVNKDRLYSAEDMNMPYKELLTEGIFDVSDDFAVAAGTGLQVTVGAGRALIGGKWVNAAITTMEVPGNTSLYSRLDSVILRMNTNIDVRAGQLIYRTGTPAETPSAPALVSDTGITEFRIANVAVAANATSITSGNITDTRGSSDCPIVDFLVAQTVRREQITDAVTAWLNEYVDPAGSAVVVDSSLTIAGAAADAKATGDQISDVKGALDDVTDIRTIPVENVLNAYFEVGAKVVVEASYTRMVYAPIEGEVAEKVTVSKIVGQLFRVGFTTEEPTAGTTIIDEAGTYIDAGEVASTTVNIPSTAKYIVAVVWNRNTDEATTSASDMIASVEIIANYGAKDNVARREIERTNSRLSNIPAEDINTFTRTGWNYLTDAPIKEIGKYWNGGTIGSPISLTSNSSYDAVMIEADASIYKFTPVRFLHALDSDKNLLQVITTDGTNSFNNESLNAKYLCFTFHADDYSDAVIYKNGTPPYEQYTASGQWVFPDLVADSISEDTIYLPSKVYCGVGRTIELYNEQIVLNSNKYHVNWVCDIGVAYARKFSVTGDNSNIGTHNLTLNLYDDNYVLMTSKTASLIITADSIATTKKVLAIGDSLTNGKEWLSEVPTLANSKIEFIGTRQLENRRSEGRSGATTTWYVSNSSYTYQDGSTYVGNPSVTGTSNPFWDGSKFSLNHYITQQSSYIGTPDAVLIMLGTNDLKQTETVVNNLKTIIDTIHTEYPNMPVLLCNTIFHSNQNGYYSTGGEGYIGVMTNWQYELDRYTIALMSALSDVFDNVSYNSFVTIVPVASCMDRENDFGQVVVPVNPRLTTVTETIPSQYTHPQSAGYLQMADAIYSAICDVF